MTKYVFNKNVKVKSDDIFKDFFQYDYLEPKMLLTDEKQIKEIEEARDLIEDFFCQAICYNIIDAKLYKED